MKRYRLGPKKPRQLTPEEQERLDKARIDYSDIPLLGDKLFAKAKQAWPPAKQQVTIRVDSDILEWLRAHGRGDFAGSHGKPGARSYPHPDSRRQKPRQGPRSAYGPSPFPDAGTAERGQQTARAGRDVAGIGR
jgi:uncharacterized protein (DUF4415 family)